MKKTTIISIVIVIILAGGAVLIAQPNWQAKSTVSLASSSNGTLSVEENSFDFGQISMAAGKVKHQFKIKNISGEPVVVGKMYTSCMCTTAKLMMDNKQFGPYGMPGHGFIPRINKAIDAGKEAIVEVTFDPAAHGPSGVGRIQRTITLENNAGQPLEFEFTALVTP